MLRKVIAALTLLLLGFPHLVGYAAENTYRLDELGLSVTIPVHLITFTRNTDENDPVFAELGITKEQMDSIMESGNLYLDAISPDGSYEVTVTMSEIQLDDFSGYSDDELLELTSQFNDVYAEDGVEIDGTIVKGIESEGVEVYDHPQEKFLRHHLKIPEYCDAIQYYTVRGGKLIMVQIRTDIGGLTNYRTDMIKRVVDSIEFDPSTQMEAARQTANDIVTREQTKDILYKCLIAAVEGGLCGLLATCYYHRHKKKAAKKKANENKERYSVQPNAPVVETARLASDKSDKQLEEKTVYCRICGTKLPKDSVFCSKCGTKVVKE